MRSSDSILRLHLYLHTIGTLLTVRERKYGRARRWEWSQKLIFLIATITALRNVRIYHLNLDGLLLLRAILTRHRYRQCYYLMLLIIATLRYSETVRINRTKVMNTTLASRQNAHYLSARSQVLRKLGRCELMDRARGQRARCKSGKWREIHFSRYPKAYNKPKTRRVFIIHHDNVEKLLTNW